MYVSKPPQGEYNSYYQSYIDKVEESDILQLLSRQMDEASALLDSFKDYGDHAYEEGKWTVKQLIQHIVDAERVFQYRALRIARQDTTPMPGFDENVYAQVADVSGRTVEDLIAELVAVRSSTYALFMHFGETDWRQLGEASGSPASVRALAYIMAGHVQHHLQILRERYTAGISV